MKPFDEIWDAFDSLSDDLHQLQNDIESELKRLDEKLIDIELRVITQEKDLNE